MFSFLLCTLNREHELRVCLDSLLLQEIQDFEIIIVDQSEGNESQRLVEKYESSKIKYFHINIKGLSKARNFGIQHISGNYVCLIDDDAVYPREFLTNILDICGPKKIVSGVIYSTSDHTTPFIDCTKVIDGEVMRVREILNFCPSAALTIPTLAFEDAGFFDERLGVGNEFAAGEETDFLLRAMDSGYEIVHCKRVIAFHPIKPVDNANLKGIYMHAMGKGALFKIDSIKRRKRRLIVFALKNTLGMYIKQMTSTGIQKEIYRNRRKGFLTGYKRFEI